MPGKVAFKRLLILQNSFLERWYYHNRANSNISTHSLPHAHEGSLLDGTVTINRNRSVPADTGTFSYVIEQNISECYHGEMESIVSIMDESICKAIAIAVTNNFVFWVDLAFGFMHGTSCTRPESLRSYIEIFLWPNREKFRNILVGSFD